MAVMANSVRNKGAVALISLLAPLSALASDWKFDPKIGVSGRYTDNVSLSSTNPQSAFITEVTPGFSLTRNSQRAKVSVDYGLQGLLYSNDSSSNTLNNQLSARLHIEPLENNFYIDADARVGQQNTNSVTGPVSNNNYNTTNNRTETYSFSVTPAWRNRFGSTAEFDARLQFSHTGSDNGALSSSNSSSLNLGLKSGSAFHKTPWGLAYRLQESDSGSKARTGSISGNVGYRPTPKTQLNLTVGTDTNNGNTNAFRQASGTYWNLGAGWNPTSRTKLDVTAGRRYNGESYGLNVSQRTRKTTWVLRYSEDITDTFSQLNGQAAFDVYECTAGTFLVPSGAPSPDPSCVLNPFTAIVPTTSLTNDTSLNRSWSGSVTWQLGKSTLSGSLSQGRRELLTTGAKDDNYSLTGTWNWRLTPRTTSNFALTSSQASSGTNNTDTWSATWALSRKMSPKTTGTLEVRHYEGDSNTAAGKYKENSAAARINMSF